MRPSLKSTAQISKRPGSFSAGAIFLFSAIPLQAETAFSSGILFHGPGSVLVKEVNSSPSIAKV